MGRASLTTSQAKACPRNCLTVRGCARAKDRQVAGDYGDLSPAIQDCVLTTPACGHELSWSELQQRRRSDRQRQNRKYSRRAGGLPLHSIFGFQHVEFARQSGGVGGFCEVIGIDRSADQNCATIGGSRNHCALAATAKSADKANSRNLSNQL